MESQYSGMDGQTVSDRMAKFSGNSGTPGGFMFFLEVQSLRMSRTAFPLMQFQDKQRLRGKSFFPQLRLKLAAMQISTVL